MLDFLRGDVRNLAVAVRHGVASTGRCVLSGTSTHGVARELGNEELSGQAA